MQMSEPCNEVIGAFIKAQSSLKTAAKDTNNPFFKSKYADLNAVWAACQDSLSENELAAIQDVKTCENGVEVTTRVFHSSGQWIECGPLKVPLGKADAQGVGSAITYGRRYGLSATLGVVADEDDDGNKASKTPPEKNNTKPEDKPEPARQLSKADAREPYKKLEAEILEQQSTTDLASWGARNKSRLDSMPTDWQQTLRNIYADHKASLEQRAVAA